MLGNRKFTYFLLLLPFLDSASQAAPEPKAALPEFSLPLVATSKQCSSDDRLATPVNINGSGPFSFIIDTSTERTVIATELAEKLSLKIGPELKISTISGPSTTPSYLIEKLEMGDVKVENIQSPSFGRCYLGGNGLLALDVLKGHKLLLDFKAGKAQLLASPKIGKSGVAEAGMEIVRSTFRNGQIMMANARIKGDTIRIVIHSGAAASMGNRALQLLLSGTDSVVDLKTVEMRGVNGEKIAGEVAMVKSMEIGGLSLRDFPVTFADNFAFEKLKLTKKPTLLLGMDAMKLFDRVMIDFVNERIGFALPDEAKNDPEKIE